MYLGSGAYGVADAAWIYFSKTPDQLTLPEAALIAGLPPAPSLYSPLVNPDLARQQRAVVLERMNKEGFITAGEAAAALNSELSLRPATPKYFNSSAPYFTSWVAQELPKLLTQEQLEVGGLKVRTSLNLDWQKKALEVIRKNAPFDTEGAMVTIEPGTGLVRVLVGGKDFSQSQFNRATQALRSPGSTFKLFPYAAAIDRGVKPEDIFIDKPRCWSGYCPKNFGAKYFGKVSLADALKNSLNTVAVQLQDKVGFDAIIETANGFDIGTKRPLGRYYPMAIGAYEQTIIDMAAAYAGVANRGVFVPPIPIEEIRGPADDLIWSRRADGPRGRKAMDSDVADAMNWMLQRVVSGGTGIAAKLDDRAVAGKPAPQRGHGISGSSVPCPSSPPPCGSATTTTGKPRAAVARPPGPGNSSCFSWWMSCPRVPSRRNRSSSAPSNHRARKPNATANCPSRVSNTHRGPSTQARRSPRSQPILGTGCCGRNRMLQLRRHRPLRLSPLGSPRPLPRPRTRSMHAETGCGHGFNQARIQAF